MDIAKEFAALFTFHGLFTLLVLSALELVLGIDNIIFISLVIVRLPQEKRFSARLTGLSLAFIMRVAMLFAIVWLSKITTHLFSVSNIDVSVRDILFFVGGAYLMWSTLQELKEHLQGKQEPNSVDIKPAAFGKIIMQIVLVDMLFSFDSIFTAIGLIQNLVIMAAAVAIGMVFMIWIAGKTSDFIERHPNIKTIALGFIMLVGFALLANAFHYNIPEEYLYIPFGLALIVELVRMRIKISRKS